MGLPGRPGGNADELRAGARTWDHLAWQIWHLNRPLEQRVDALFEGWVGRAADGYRARWEEVRRGLGELDHRLHTVADRLRVLAGHIEDAQSAYDHALAAAGIATAAGIGLTVFTLGASDLLAGEADTAVAATVAGCVAEFELALARMAALMGEAAELLGGLASRFAVEFPVVAPRLALSPAGGAAIGIGVSLASGERDPGAIALSGLAGAGEAAGERWRLDEEPELPQPAWRGTRSATTDRLDEPSWEGPTTFDAHAIKSMRKRGWTEAEVDGMISQPERTARVRDTHWLSDGRRADDPATAYMDSRGNYVIRNDRTGRLLQVSRKDDPAWKRPFHGS